MRVLITGNMGYVGPAVVRHLRRICPDAWLVGYDTGLFAHCVTSATLPEIMLDEQHFGDIRDIKQADLEDFDAVVHLAAVSNDPIGNRFEEITSEVNYHASVRTAKAACGAGVRSFVFASSCSVYGFAADGRARRESDPLNPLTAYARSKIATEESLKQMERGGMAVTCLRFATACGMSDRLRLDLVVNDFVASALATGTISVLSDGKPWRPLIDVRDMARAIEWAITRNTDGDFLAINVGSEKWTYQICDLASAVAQAIPSTKVSINTAAPADRRSYKVDFGLYKALAPNHLPSASLEDSIATLRDGLTEIGFEDPNFRDSQLIRLRVLDQHIATGTLSPALRWVERAAPRASPIASRIVEPSIQ
jgi:nucleoside-diphosphate-sugar epimerase